MSIFMIINDIKLQDISFQQSRLASLQCINRSTNTIFLRHSMRRLRGMDGLAADGLSGDSPSESRQLTRKISLESLRDIENILTFYVEHNLKAISHNFKH